MTRLNVIMLRLTLFVCYSTVQGRSLDKQNIVKTDSPSFLVRRISSGNFGAFSFSIGAGGAGVGRLQGETVDKDMLPTKEIPQPVVTSLPRKEDVFNTTNIQVSAHHLNKSDDVKANSDVVNSDKSNHESGESVSKPGAYKVYVDCKDNEESDDDAVAYVEEDDDDDKGDDDDEGDDEDGNISDNVDDNCIIPAEKGFVFKGEVTERRFEHGSIPVKESHDTSVTKNTSQTLSTRIFNL